MRFKTCMILEIKMGKKTFVKLVKTQIKKKFFSGRTTKRGLGGGVKPPNQRKKTYFYQLKQITKTSWTTEL